MFLTRVLRRADVKRGWFFGEPKMMRPIRHLFTGRLKQKVAEKSSLAIKDWIKLTHDIRKKAKKKRSYVRAWQRVSKRSYDRAWQRISKRESEANKLTHDIRKKAKTKRSNVRAWQRISKRSKRESEANEQSCRLRQTNNLESQQTTGTGNRGEVRKKH